MRVQFPGAIYHVTSRGDRRQPIVVDDLDRDTFFQRIGATVQRFHWEMFAAVLMTNHFHLFFRTPQPNLSRGMQFLLGGYASWWNARHDYTGHVFQGRFHGFVVEDETYFWSVSRYAHLNPTPVLVPRPEQWKWSTYAGYLNPDARVPWVDYDTLLHAWQGEFGGNDPVDCYRQYVEQGLANRPVSPFQSAIDGWILGSDKFADQVWALITPEHRRPRVKKRRRKTSLTMTELIETICDVLEVNPDTLTAPGSRNPARAIFAYLSRKATNVTLAQLAKQLGLSHPDSVPNQIRRLTDSPPDSELRRQLQIVQTALGL